MSHGQNHNPQTNDEKQEREGDIERNNLQRDVQRKEITEPTNIFLFCISALHCSNYVYSEQKLH